MWKCSNLKEKYNRLTDIQKCRGRLGGGKYHHKLIKEPGLKVWHMQSGKELSLTSQSRNNKPGSAKPKKEVCNGFMSKFILFLLVCLDIRTSQIHVPTDTCFYTTTHLPVCIILLITLLFYRARMLHQLVLLLFKCYYAHPSKRLKWILSPSVPLMLYLQSPGDQWRLICT